LAIGWRFLVGIHPHNPANGLFSNHHGPDPYQLTDLEESVFAAITQCM